MVDLLKQNTTPKEITLRITDDSAVDTATITAGALTCERDSDAAETLSVAFVSKTPATGDAAQIDAVFSVAPTNFGDDYVLKLNDEVIGDDQGEGAPAADLVTGIRVYATLEMTMDNSKPTFNGGFNSGGNAVWVFADDQNSESSNEVETDFLNITFNTSETRTIGIKFFREPTEITTNQNAKVEIDQARLADGSGDFDLLTRLELNGSNSNFSSFDFSTLPLLNRLALSNTPSVITDAQLAAIPNLANIALSSTASPISDAAFPTPSQLTSLNLNNCTQVTLTDATVSAATLTYLDMSNCGLANLTDTSLNALGSATFINLGNCGGTFTGAGVANLTSVTNLTLNTITLTGVTDATFSGLTQLQILKMSGNTFGVTSAGFNPLVNLTQFEAKTMGWDDTFLNALLTNLNTNSPNLTLVDVRGNTGSATVDTTAGSGYDLLINRGVTVQLV